MSTQRLTFLYPHLFRTARLGETAPSRGPSRCARLRPPPRRRQHAAPFGTSTTSGKASFAPRSGKGIEPKPLGSVQDAPALESHMRKDASSAAAPAPQETQGVTAEQQRKDAAKALDPAAEPAVKATLSSPGVSSADKKKKKNNNNTKKQEEPPPPPPPQPQSQAKDDTATGAAEPGQDGEAASGKKRAATGPMDAVLHMGPPEDVPPEDKPPHLTPPPYVHHFDSYSLVKQLEEGGWTNAQAITAMKAVRALLAQNLDVAQGGLIGKSDVENETYLFRAACAELSTEVRNNRRIADEQSRQQRTVLQHEVDNTTQVMNQELLTLNDNVKGMFNDRKMAVREEQKAAESAVGPIITCPFAPPPQLPSLYPTIGCGLSLC